MAALTNEKEDIFDQIHANNIVERSGDTFTARNKKKISGGSSEKFKNLPPPLCRHRFIYPCILCPLHSNPSRDLVLLIQEELENLYKIPKRGDVKFLLKSDAHKKYLDPN